MRGQVDHPRSFSMARLRGLPQHTVRVRYQTSHGAEKHTVTGPLLADVLKLAGPRIGPDVKNAQLRLFVTATGSKEGPRLVAPGDVKGGRYVSGVLRLHPRPRLTRPLSAAASCSP
ncbi:hypothetical protein ACWEPL_56875 [Nonomuraea sp. NPDC004186]